jgi:formamidopyrimidine-DNA glycosylase
MPELPEVETMRRGLRGAEGGTVVSIRRSRCRKQPIRVNASWPAISRALRHRKLDRVDRHGKRLILRFDNGSALVIEPRMTGLLVTEGEPGREHLRFEIRLRGSRCPRIAFWDQRGLGQVFLFDPAGIASYLSPRNIGPDALKIRTSQLQANLSHRSIPVKVGLLDQKSVAGVGNIYASEILHLCGIDPRRPCRDVLSRQWPEIHRQMLIVLKSAIRHEGSTLRDGTYRNTLNKSGGYQNHHRVYDRKGERCRKCDRGTIQRIVQAQRSTYFCDRCQKQ